ncbi:hypothetical protein SBRY_30134 [Actinacidiphila bryophytorum]|uniref:Uncharacterized protein n=1 Tax=Actinacidiphila bryophytorum TaxID=1436133 RepID=A0A9W4H0G1_9ACTN|nr:hypothetical protein SBRY_30134 [Actinacidiphila bryophytorum]
MGTKNLQHFEEIVSRPLLGEPLECLTSEGALGAIFRDECENLGGGPVFCHRNEYLNQPSIIGASQCFEYLDESPQWVRAADILDKSVICNLVSPQICQKNGLCYLLGGQIGNVLKLIGCRVREICSLRCLCGSQAC